MAAVILPWLPEIEIPWQNRQRGKLNYNQTEQGIHSATAMRPD
jgi:hypothetical protein